MINFFILLPSLCVKFKNDNCTPSNQISFLDYIVSFMASFSNMIMRS
jgi:hypothetical protein